MGRVIFIGAGPGAADLITVRGAERLGRAQVVLFDALTDPALRAHAPTARWIDVGKRGYAHATEQATIDALLVRLARTHAVVVRLKGGDGGVFGRLEEELLALQAAGIECEIVPGITAALAAAAQVQRPLTRRGQGRSVALRTAVTQSGPATATDQAQAQAQAHAHADTEVFYMAGRQLATLGKRLRAQGWCGSTPVSVVSRAGWPDALHSDHRLDDLGCAALLHGGRPTVVTLGVGAQALTADTAASAGKTLITATAKPLVQTPAT